MKLTEIAFWRAGLPPCMVTLGHYNQIAPQLSAVNASLIPVSCPLTSCFEFQKSRQRKNR